MPSTPRQSVQALLAEVERLLERHRVLSSLASRQASPKRDLLEQMQHRQNLVDLERRLRGVHPADLASILEALPTDDRLLVWRQLAPGNAGPVLVELDENVLRSMLEDLDHDELVRALATLDADDLAYLSMEVDDAVIAEVSAGLAAAGRSWLVDTLAYPEDSVGRLMSLDVVEARDDQTVAQVIEDLRARRTFPDQTDRLFVVDIRHVFRGAVPLHALVRAAPDVSLASLVIDVDAFLPDAPAADAASAFERYDLVSAPVVDGRRKLIGRVTIDAVLDFVREASDQRALARAGLRGAEDLFAPVADSVRNRWPWLGLNLLTAFAASRVIGAFESTITQIAALAALMPIVASIGGNTGNQTVALVVRALAVGQLREGYPQMVRRELTVSLVNGAVWGLVVGVVALWLYRSAALAGVMSAAVVLNLVVAALAGLAVPMALQRLKRDPAQGASVILTFVTDSMGFFLFLGLARLVLV